MGRADLVDQVRTTLNHYGASLDPHESAAQALLKAVQIPFSAPSLGGI